MSIPSLSNKARSGPLGPAFPVTWLGVNSQTRLSTPDRRSARRATSLATCRETDSVSVTALTFDSIASRAGLKASASRAPSHGFAVPPPER